MADGFTNVEVLTVDDDVRRHYAEQDEGQHGRGEILKRAGQVCGVVFKHAQEKTLYIAAAVWFEGFREAIDVHKPDIIVVNGETTSSSAAAP